jgi:signal transduction histidine kinase
LAIYEITEVNAKQRINMALDESLRTLKTHYEILLYTQDTTAKTLFDSTMKEKGFLELFSEVKNATKDRQIQIREEIYKLLLNKYKRAKQKGVLQYQLVLPDNTSFLRMHKPLKFGDDLTYIRDDLVYVNKYKKHIRGFTQGRTAHGFRNSFPIFGKDGSYLGALEISFSSDRFQNYLTKISHIHTHFIVDKKIFDTKTWVRNDMILKYSQSTEHKDFMITITDQHSQKKCIHENRNKLKPLRNFIDKHIENGKSFSTYVEYENNVSIISFMAIKNINNKTVAWLVSYTESDFIKYTIQSKIYLRIFTFIFSLIIMYFIILQVKAKAKRDELYKKLEEVNKSLEDKITKALEENTKQLQALQQQSKMASMGEMIGAIAHQWRQPLNTIGTSIQNLKYDYKEGLIDDEFLKEFIDKNKKTIKFMSKTIDDFRSFFRIDKEKVKFNVFEITNSVVNMQSAQLKNHHITVNVSGDEFEYIGLQSEYQQVVLNLITNAKDALIDNHIKNPIIDIKIEDNKIYVKDNAGGIPKDIIDRVFEPYFTTKEQGKGTGMGLYMSKMIIEDNMGGTLSVNNIDDGALFIIEFGE